MKGNRNTHYAVRNINGTSKNKCQCDSWIAHWRAATKSRRARCCALECGKDASVGAHVRIDDARFYGHWYIVPFCRTHNHFSQDGTIYIKRDTELISASVAYTCGRTDWWT